MSFVTKFTGLSRFADVFFPTISTKVRLPLGPRREGQVSYGHYKIEEVASDGKKSWLQDLFAANCYGTTRSGFQSSYKPRVRVLEGEWIKKEKFYYHSPYSYVWDDKKETNTPSFSSMFPNLIWKTNPPMYGPTGMRVAMDNAVQLSRQNGETPYVIRLVENATSAKVQRVYRVVPTKPPVQLSCYYMGMEHEIPEHVKQQLLDNYTRKPDNFL